MNKSSRPIIGSIARDYIASHRIAGGMVGGELFLFVFYVILFVLFCLCLLDFILYVPSTIFQLNRDGFSAVEPVLS